MKLWSLAASITAALGTLAASAASPTLDSARSMLEERGIDLVDPAAVSRYIVHFAAPPLALYDGSVATMAAIPRRVDRGRTRPDMQSPQAKQYVAWLGSEQDRVLQRAGQQLKRTLTPIYRYHYALDAVLLSLTSAEAAALRRTPGVTSVQPDRTLRLTTDLSPALTMASAMWAGHELPPDTLFGDTFERTGTRGEGVVVGVLDTGYNSSSPSFTATDQDGRTVRNPLGSGQYLGDCDVAGIADQPCNDKVIGVWDMISRLLAADHRPVSVEDANGHGTHTASTAAGNRRTARLSAGFSLSFSGMAPASNLMIFRVCLPNGNCSESAAAAAVDAAIESGVADALNFSISGGNSPWSDEASLAFLAAERAGIFVAAAAGNSRAGEVYQDPGTADHGEPWVTTVAASTHSGYYMFAFDLGWASGTDSGPPALELKASFAAQSGDSYSIILEGADPAPLTLSPTYFATPLPDGCAAFPAGTFRGSIAVVHGALPADESCGYTTKVANAAAAGATAVIVVDTPDVAVDAYHLLGSDPGVPVYGLSNAQGTELANFLRTASRAVAGVDGKSGHRLQGRRPDVLGDFSLLGPLHADLVKPDVQASGVDILASFVGSPNAINLLSGTSMASPHVAGAAALLIAAHPDWTPMQVKSAVMQASSTHDLRRPDGTTPSTPFDRGAGSLRVYPASQVGLTLDESASALAGADPARGGDPRTLNLASVQVENCAGWTPDTGDTAACEVTRRVSSETPDAVTWTADLRGLEGYVTPRHFTVQRPAATTLTVHVDNAHLASDSNDFRFGEVVLTPSDASYAPLHWPVAVARSPAGALEVPARIDVALADATVNGTVDTQVGVRNSGGRSLTLDTLHFAGKRATGRLFAPALNTHSAAFNRITPTLTLVAAQALRVYGPVDITALTVRGVAFTTTGAGALRPGDNVQADIYADDDGEPAGYPGDATTPAPLATYAGVMGADPAAPIFQNWTARAPGVSLGMDEILVQPDEPLAQLNTGKYWFLLYPRLDDGTEWVEYLGREDAGDGLVGTDFGQRPIWDPLYAPASGMKILGTVNCGASWLQVDPIQDRLVPNEHRSLRLSIDVAAYRRAGSPGGAYVCLSADEPAPATPRIVTVRIVPPPEA